MPRFYFDRSGGGGIPKPDADGLIFDTLADAGMHAMTLLPVAGIELPVLPGEFRTWTLSIRDEGGITAARFVMAIIHDYPDHAAVTMLHPMA